MRYNVSNVEGAAEQLLQFKKHGAHWRRATEACIAAMEGRATAQEVRRCFRLAAKAEGVLLAG
ncbi:DUF982 domain-containing protein [Mesorhizobium sp. M0016]|uniref:DUF982 domain-containing protein n=1 Tax=Mesorhizobium sp. M0016 TaxID=2956843 RepID=UPI0033387F12